MYQPIKQREGRKVHHINIKGIFNGIFIQGINREEIKKITIYLNISNTTHERLKYDCEDISYFTKKINDKLIYLPLSMESSWDSVNYNGALNTGRFDTISLFLEAPSFDGNIIALIPNSLVIMDGLVLLETNYTVEYDPKMFPGQWINEKMILSGNVLCPIICDKIDDQYIKCDNCHNNFHIKVRRWIDSNHKCPTCIQDWTEYKIYSSDNKQDISNGILYKSSCSGYEENIVSKKM